MKTIRRLLIGRGRTDVVRTFQYSVLTTSYLRLWGPIMKSTWNNLSNELERLDKSLPDGWDIDVFSDVCGRWYPYNRTKTL